MKRKVIPDPGSLRSRRIILWIGLTRNVLWTALTLILFLQFIACMPGIQKPSSENIRSLISQRVGPAESEEIIIPFEIDDEIRKAAIDATRGLSSSKEKMTALLSKILNKKDINLKYDQYKSYTAIETFRNGRGNCLAFTNLLVGMARSVGVDAFFVEILEISEYDLLEGLVVNQRHICCGYYSGTKVELIDFASNAKKYLGYKKMEDLEAISSYYNNLGYDALMDGKIEDSIKNFTLSIRISPDFTWGYNNLGVTLSRRKDYQEAIYYYERAIELAPDYEAPHGNLANLYLQMGEKEKGEKYLNLLNKVESKNPYHRISRGLFLKEQGNLEEAIKEMKKAIFFDRENVAARVELARIYITLGHTRLARHHLKKALIHSPGNPDIIQALNSLTSKNSPEN
ncbi:MAG: tetratricopeptide repeat protein [Acidobacteriota bacterium]